MPEPKPKEREPDPDEVARRRDEALRRALNTPPKRHEERRQAEGRETKRGTSQRSK